jgi:MerR family transcriptional regulator/heat shock protein HspR
MEAEDYEPRYVISIAAKIIGIHAQTLRYYERMGLIEPLRSPGNIRLYSKRDIERLQQIKTLMNDLGVNLAGVEVIMRMAQCMTEMEQQVHELEQEVKRLSEGGSMP